VFLKNREFAELQKYLLSSTEWNTLKLFKDILRVLFLLYNASISLTINQIPQSCQQLLSAEKYPTLGSALLAFQSMQEQWKVLQAQKPETHTIIAAGLAKLQDYEEHALMNPTYAIATSKYL
jgi:hypothetical protein